MTSSLDELLTRSAALGGRLSVGEALEINQAILEIDPENEIAATRLGIGLLSADRVQDAVPVLEAAVLAHPGNAFASQASGAGAARPRPPGDPRAQAAGRARPRAASGSRPCPTPTGGASSRASCPGSTTPGSSTRTGTACSARTGRRRAGRPGASAIRSASTPVRPSASRCSGEVAQVPAFDPAFVAVESGSAKDGQRWPWVTMIRVLHCAPTDTGPTLEELGIAERGMQLRTRKLLDDAQAKVLLGALRAT